MFEIWISGRVPKGSVEINKSMFCSIPNIRAYILKEVHLIRRKQTKDRPKLKRLFNSAKQINSFVNYPRVVSALNTWSFVWGLTVCLRAAFYSVWVWIAGTYLANRCVESVPPLQTYYCTCIQKIIRRKKHLTEGPGIRTAYLIDVRTPWWFTCSFSSSAVPHWLNCLILNFFPY